jgi:hypothetical protein
VATRMPRIGSLGVACSFSRADAVVSVKDKMSE